MKMPLFAVLLLASASSFGALVPATGDRLTDYSNWFAGLQVGPGVEPADEPAPPILPWPMVDRYRTWSGWTPNWGWGDTIGPLMNSDFMVPLVVEVVSLGAKSIGGWGYRLGGIDTILGLSSPGFGDHTEILVGPGETLDFFVLGEGDSRFFALDTTLTLPPEAGEHSYYGTLLPLAGSRRDDEFNPFLVFAFETSRAGGVGGDFTDFVFALQATIDVPCCGMVPEPGTCGMAAALALGFFVLIRRIRCAK